MAGEAEKKRAKRNGDILLVLRAGTAAAFAVYAALRVLVFAFPSRWVMVCGAALAALNGFLVVMLGRWSADVDLTDRGLVEYMRDGVYGSWIILLLALASDWAFLLLLLFPALAVYKLLNVLPGGGMSGGGGDEDAHSGQKRAPKKASTLSKAEKIALSGAEYRGGKPKFSRH